MAKSKIIVISTHLLEEVEAVCNRAIIIARGKILADDTPRGLEARSRFYNAVSLKLSNPELIPAAGVQNILAVYNHTAAGRGI